MPLRTLGCIASLCLLSVVCGGCDKAEMKDIDFVLEAERAAVDLYSGYVRIGRGTLVYGIQGKGDSQLSLITSREVVTYPGFIEGTMRICNGEKEFRLGKTIDRWFATNADANIAWLELSEAEIVAAKRAGFKKGVEIDIDAEDSIARVGGEVRVWSVYQHEAVAGIIKLSDKANIVLPHSYNRYLRKSKLSVIPMKSDRLCVSGESGSPVVMSVEKDGATHPVVVGIVLAGNAILKVNAVHLVSEAREAIRRDKNLLYMMPALW